MADESASAGVVENLVTQFSNALDCFRELVQNSIDSGSARVEVWSEYQVGEGHLGAIIFHVDDYGEGMDEAIIDQQLTQLFSSSKEGDLTKIGKFGIGFVSVFALKPKAVLVNTGRGGEYWEVLFHEDRSFSKSRLDVPVEGTQVALFLEGDYRRYGELVGGVRETLRRWCSHSETEITFEDRSSAGGGFSELEVINEPFAVEGDCPTKVEVQGTEIALAYSEHPVYGFYNRGLTLASTEVGDQIFSEARSARFRRIAVKLKSRYLEHTLSRETVLRDENYEKAMALLDQGADGPLLEGLAAALAELVARPSWGLVEMTRYAQLAAHLLGEPERNLLRLVDEPLLRGVFGAPLSPAALAAAFKREGRVLLSEQPTELVREVVALGVPVVLGRAPDRARLPGGAGDEEVHPLDAVYKVVLRFLSIQRERSLVGRVRRLLGQDPTGAIRRGLVSPESIYLHVALDQELPPAVQGLLGEAQRLLAAVDAGYRVLRTFSGLASTSSPPFFVTGRRLSPLMGLPAPGEGGARSMEAAVNRDHPHFAALVELWSRSPRLAAYCLAKCLLLTEDRLLDRDVMMMQAALGAGSTRHGRPR